MLELGITDALQLDWRTKHGWSTLTISGGAQPVSFSASTALNEDELVSLVLSGGAVVFGARAAEFSLAGEPGEHRFTIRYLPARDVVERTVEALEDSFACELPQQGRPVLRLTTDHPSLARAAPAREVREGRRRRRGPRARAAARARARGAAPRRLVGRVRAAARVAPVGENVRAGAPMLH